MPTPASTALRPVCDRTREREVEHQPVHRHDHERHEQRAAQARQRAAPPGRRAAPRRGRPTGARRAASGRAAPRTRPTPRRRGTATPAPAAAYAATSAPDGRDRAATSPRRAGRSRRPEVAGPLEHDHVPRRRREPVQRGVPRDARRATPRTAAPARRARRGPSPNGGKHRPVRTPATSAAPRRVQLGSRATRRSCGVTRRRRCHEISAVLAELPSLSASWRSGSTRKHDWHRNSPGRRGTIASGPRRARRRRLVVLDLLFVVLERRLRGALLEQRVERRLDVVGVELLVEVDAVLVVVLVARWPRRRGGGRRVVGDHGAPGPRGSSSTRRRPGRRRRPRRRGPRRPRGRRPRASSSSSSVFVFFELVVAHQGSAASTGTQVRGSRARSITPRPLAVATQTAMSPRFPASDDGPGARTGKWGAQETVGATGWPGLLSGRVIAAFSTWSPGPPPVASPSPSIAAAGDRRPGGRGRV